MNLKYFYRKLNVLSCRRASEMVSQSLDRRLGLVERWRLHVHLQACQACRRFSNQMAFLRRAVRRHPLFGDRDD
jgi:predicted anti-sigma-YlaC factor YlaD